jgi:CheY-like chemotaxis protein
MEKPKILIVEDEYIVAENMQVKIEEWDYSVIGIESTGLNALKKIEETPPDLVLMDIKIKGEMDGIETATKIKKQFGIPIIYLTSFSDIKILERAQLTEPYGFLIKPYNERELKATIKMALYKSAIDKKLASVKTMLLSVFNSIGVGIIITDSSGGVKLINPTAQKIIRKKKEDSIGKDIGEVFPIQIRQKDSEIQSEIINFSEISNKIITLGIENDVLLVTPDNKQVFIYGSVSPVIHNRMIIGSILAFQRKRKDNNIVLDEDQSESAYELPQAVNMASDLLKSGIITNVESDQVEE